MNERPFAIVTTRLPPDACGIGTYSSSLRRHWPGQNREVHFLVIEGGASADRKVEGDSITDFNNDAQQLAQALQQLGAADVLLHFAGRAFQRHGCPVWMPGVFRAWKRRFPPGRLMVFFHELPGEMPMTSVHFWLGRLNARIVRQLVELADVVATNTERHSTTLRQISGRNDVQLVPVASNIQADNNDSSERAATEFVLFGLSFGRLQTLQMFDEHLRCWIEGRRLTQLHIIGPANDRFAQEADELISQWPNPGVALRHGVLPSAEVAHLLGRAAFAITNVTAETWGKSSAFMACAATCCSVITRSRSPDLVPLVYAIAADEVETIPSDEVHRRTAALAKWYYENADWPVIARRLAAAWDQTHSLP